MIVVMVMIVEFAQWRPAIRLINARMVEPSAVEQTGQQEGKSAPILGCPRTAAWMDMVWCASMSLLRVGVVDGIEERESPPTWPAAVLKFQRLAGPDEKADGDGDGSGEKIVGGKTTSLYWVLVHTLQ
jgi:hypothetical protein